MFKKIFFILFLLISMQSNCRAEEEITSFGVIWRSAVFPGIGQYYNNDVLKGGVFAGLEVLSIGATVYFYVAGNNSWESYKDATNSEDASKYYDLTKKNDELFLYSQCICIGIWAVNIIDAVFLNNINETSASVKDKTTLKIDPVIDRFALRYNKSSDVFQLVCIKNF